MTMTDKSSNGLSKAPLPPAREAVVEQGNRLYQEVAHERDELRKTLHERNADIAGYKIALEAKDAQLTEMIEAKDARIADLESRMQTAYVVRDAMVAKAEERRVVLVSIAAQLQAFDLSEVLAIRGTEDHAV